MPCFRTSPVTTNSQGFRDTEWKKGNEYEIALLGDSFIEALMVRDGSHLATLLESITGIQSMNAALSGQGTIAQFFTYRHIAAEHHPKIVILFYYAGNDLLNNHCGLNRSSGNTFVEPCPCAEFESDTFRFVLPPSGSNRSNWISWCKSCAAFDHIFVENSIPVSPEKWDIYFPPYGSDLANSVKATEKALLNLDLEVRQNGGKLFVVTIPAFLEFTEDPYDEIRKLGGLVSSRQGLDTAWPTQVMTEIAGRNGIAWFSLTPGLKEYSKKFNLKFPWFFFTCNGHWNPLGHHVAANLVAQQLLERNLIQSTPEIKNKIESNLILPPAGVLSDKGFRQIYSGEVFELEAE